ncbi:MAG: Chromosome partition protein Smc [Anaerolineae bacterium]|nr:Chromosome partition protein Smc [Anaerolineae bacterium]
MEQLMTQAPWLVILAALLLGMLIMWLLELFFLRRNLKSELTNLDASLKQRDADLQSARSSLEQTEAALNGKTADLTSALNGRAAAETQIADLKTQLTKSNADLDATRQTRQQLETTLNTRAAEATDLRVKLNALSGERDELRANFNNAQSELDTTRAQQRGSLAEIAKLTAAAAATAAIVKGLETSKTDLTAQIATLNGELSTARSDADYLRARLDQTEAERVKLDNSLVAAGAAKETLEITLADTTQRANDLDGIKTALEGQVGQLQDKTAALDGDIAKLTAGALAASQVIKLLEGDKTALTVEKSQLQGEFDALQKAKALDDAELAESKLQLSHVNTALGITKRDKETYQQTLAERVTELGEAQTQLTRAKQDNNNLLADIAKFTARAAAATALAQGLEDRKRDLSAQVEQLRGELDAERAKGATLTASVAAAPEAESQAQTLAALQAEDDAAEPLEAACPQDLSAVRGVGAEFEQRLYDAGIGTYWDLAQRSESELAVILNLGDLQATGVNVAAIRGDALRLARETKTQKRTWKGGAPDDFDRIGGIGRVYEGRLYEAGICTYAALAQCSVEQLAAICRAPQFNANHFQNWIDQARALIAG